MAENDPGLKEYAIIRAPLATVYGVPAETTVNQKGERVWAISDENFYGCVCRVLEPDRDGWTRVLSHYGYAGWMKSEALRPVTAEEARAWLGAALRVASAGALDVLSLPSVHGEPLVTLPAGALLEALPDAPAGEGWLRVRLHDGREGYVPPRHLAVKRFGEPFLWRDPAPVLEALADVSGNARTAKGGDPAFSFAALLDEWYGGSEARFRAHLTGAANAYLGVQYRWGGRSSWGIDCSGLISMAYLRSGVCVYRDASLARGWPLRRIDLKWDGGGRFLAENLDSGAMRPGDALFFPGHVALYLGDGRYIHATGHAGDSAVVYNSLRPGAPDFREDLFNSLYAVGGLRLENTEEDIRL